MDSLGARRVKLAVRFALSVLLMGAAFCAATWYLLRFTTTRWIEVNASALAGLSDPVSSLSGLQRVAILTLLACVGVGILIVAIGLKAISTRAIAPTYKQLRHILLSFARADYDVEIPSYHPNPEIQSIFAALTEMRDQVSSYMRTVSEAASEVSAVSSSLAEDISGISESLSTTCESIDAIAKKIVEQDHGATEVSDSVKQLQMAIEQIAKGAQAQAASSTDAANIVSEMVETMKESESAVAESSTASANNTTFAETGGKSVQRVIEGMQRIREAVLQAASTIDELDKSSQQIGEIISVINDIAEQTDLLALNAAIEAARAGDAGKGFAVVADEVRRLAERSSNATKEIAALINGIRESTKSAVSAMQDGTNEVNAGSQLAEEAGEALNQILQSARGANAALKMIQMIFEQLQENSKAIDSSVTNIASIIEESTAAIEEMAANSSQVVTSVQHIADTTKVSADMVAVISQSSRKETATLKEMTKQTARLAARAEELRKITASVKCREC